MCLSGEIGLLFNLLLPPLSPLHSPLFPLYPLAAIYSVDVMSDEVESHLLCMQAALACVYQEVRHTTLCGGAWCRLFWFKYISGEMVFRTSTSTFALPSHSFYLSSIPFLSPISHFPPLPAFPASHLHCLLLPSNQLSVHIHLPTPIRCGIGNHYTNTHYKFTPPHASTKQVHRSLHGTSHRLQAYKRCWI